MSDEAATNWIIAFAMGMTGTVLGPRVLCAWVWLVAALGLAEHYWWRA